MNIHKSYTIQLLNCSTFASLMQKNLTKRIIGLGLLVSLSIPFVINSLHFILFEHHFHNLYFTKGENLAANEKTHQICQWEFAIEELVDAKIELEAPNSLQPNIVLFNDKSIIVQKEEYFLLRAPPIS